MAVDAFGISATCVGGLLGEPKAGAIDCQRRVNEDDGELGREVTGAGKRPALKRQPPFLDPRRISAMAKRNDQAEDPIVEASDAHKPPYTVLRGRTANLHVHSASRRAISALTLAQY